MAKKQLRVALCCPTLLMRRPISELARGLAERGHSITVVGPRRVGRAHDSSLHHVALLDHPRITVVTYPVVQLPFTEFEWPIPINPFQIFSFMRLFRRNDAVHMWTYFYLSSVLLALARSLTGGRLITTLDTMPGKTLSLGNSMDRLFNAYNATLGKAVLDASDRVTVYSARIPVESAVVLGTGVQPITRPPAKAQAWERPIVTFVGLLNRRKGVDTLVRAAPRIDATVLIVGDGPLRATLERNAPSNVIFLGRRKDVPSILAQTDVFLFPTRGEGLAGVVFEAMQHGLPVVTSDVPCVDEQIVPGKGGFLLDSEDVGSFVDKTNLLLHDSALRKRMGTFNKRRIRQFSWDDLVPRYEALYR